VELLFGQLNEKMPIGKRHRDCVDKINVYFVLKFQSRYRYGVQNPLTLGTNSEPEPDYLIFDPETYRQHPGQPLPKDVLLLIEVSDKTLAFDRSDKAALYAHAGIAEYWIINLQSDQLELHLEPNADLGEYSRIQRYAADAEFDSPFVGSVRVSDLVPE
jgi:Uma2 family endonuclease